MKITPQDTTFRGLFLSKTCKYYVPEYQRDYSWTPDEVKEMLGDVLRASEASREYFIGTMVLNKGAEAEDSDCESVEIIDGQQRLATYTVVFSAIRNVGIKLRDDSQFLPNIDRTDEIKRIAERIIDIAKPLVVTTGHTYEDHYHLHMNKKDRPIMFEEVQKSSDVLWDDSALKVNKSDPRVRKAKKTVYKFLRDASAEKGGEFPKFLYEFVKAAAAKVKLVTLTVESDYDAYSLFESLNSKGLDLSMADLLKNKLIMSADGEDARKSVVQNWDLMLSSLQVSSYKKVSDFLRFYWSAFQVNTSKTELYREIKKYIDVNGASTEELSQELKAKAVIFSEITSENLVWPNSTITPGSLDDCLAELNTLRYQICIPALLYAKAKYSESDVKRLAVASHTYLFRLITVCQLSVGLADQAFKSVLTALRQGGDMSEICRNLLSEDKISDERFASEFSLFSTTDSSIARYILTKIQIFKSGYETSPHQFHLEHILPQEPKRWIDLGFVFPADIPREDLVWNIGNMTLLDGKINSSIQNSPFKEKIGHYKRRDAETNTGTSFQITFEIADRFEESPFDWTAEEIRKRASDLALIATKIWKLH